jgi:mannosyltransferase OCH1-like enzyme
MIPKTIHISWKDHSILTDNHIFPRACVQNLIALVPDWNVEISTNNEIDNYLKTQLDSQDWNLLKDCHIVEKLDVWRLLKLYLEGGLYVDIDRLCNTSLNDIIKSETKCVLPTCGDIDFSQDFMCSAAGNPIYSTTLELNLQRRREGFRNIYFLGPQTFMHGVTKALVGEIIDVNPGREVFVEIRKMLSEMPFITTYVETSPYDTIIHRPENAQIDFDHEEMKRDYYAKSNLKHWTGDW